MVASSQTPETNISNLPWREAIARYQHPEAIRSIWQIVNTVPLYFIMLYVMYRSLEISYWLTLLLAPVAAGLLARTFIIFHDCGHGSFFKSQKANDLVGCITGIIAFTPYFAWRRDHAIHHATAGDLSRRGVGDVKTLTVKEFMALPPLRQLGYRLYRNPIILFLLAPLGIFLVAHRFMGGNASKRERNNVYLTNLALAAYLGVEILLMGFKPFLLVQIPVLMLGFSGGVWLFYVQHQFEGTYWEDHKDWDYATAAIKGSSFYKLPKILQWFTGSIGFHHIHHLSPRIPNYFLEKCYKENPMFQEIKPVTLLTSLKSLTYRLWDEDEHKLVGYAGLKKYQDVRGSVLRD